MPLPAMNNPNSFSLRVRAAKLRVAAPQLDPGEAAALAQSQYTEGERSIQAAGGGSYSTEDPRRMMLENPQLGQRTPGPGGFGPGGPIDVNSYAGSRYSPQNMMTEAPQPGALPSYQAGTVNRLMQDTGHDPASRAVLQTQNLALLKESRQTEIENRRSIIAQREQGAADRATEDGAIKAASSPSVGIAQQIMNGAGFQDLSNEAPADPSMAYLQNGGKSPGMVQALMREKPFSASESTLPSGTRMIQNSPHSFIPDPQQARARPAGAPKDDQPEYSADGKFFRSGPEDKWQPVPASHDKPLNVTEWLMSGKPEGTYKAYRDAHAKESSAVPDATGAPKAAGKAPAQAKAAAPWYRHEDVQAELKRRGLVK